MGSSISPLATAALIALSVCLAGIFINAYKRAKLYSGYRDVEAATRRIAKEIKAQVFRDGDDLVISGGTVQLPTVLRFSHAENTPGMNLRVHAPVTFAFSIVPKGTRATEGRVAIRTGNDVFDSRFVARTDHPTQVRMLLSQKKIMRQLEKLCCSSRTFLTMNNGVMELSELMIPENSLVRHVLDHIDSLSEITRTLHEMPGAESVNIAPVPREETTLATKSVVAAGALAALMVVFVAAKSSHSQETAEMATRSAEGPEGVNPAEAARMPAMMGWRAARIDELSPAFLEWIRDHGADTSGHIIGDFSDAESKTDSAYLLVRGDQRRVVLLVQGRDWYDYAYSQLAGMVRVPQDSLQDIQWRIEPQARPKSSALMLVTDAENPASGVVIFSLGNRVYTGVPKDYRTVQLK